MRPRGFSPTTHDGCAIGSRPTECRTTRASAHVAVLGDAATMEAALTWYRARGAIRSPLGKISVPTLYIWGDADDTVGRAAAEDTVNDAVNVALSVRGHDGVGHFAADQAPRPGQRAAARTPQGARQQHSHWKSSDTASARFIQYGGRSSSVTSATGLNTLKWCRRSVRPERDHGLDRRAARHRAGHLGHQDRALAERKPRAHPLPHPVEGRGMLGAFLAEGQHRLRRHAGLDPASIFYEEMTRVKPG